jgi:protein SCO1
VNRAQLTALSLLFVAFAGALAAERPALKSGAFDPPRVAPDFTLRGTNGSEIKLSGYRGKVVALGFGYTFCPDVCPTTLADLADVRKKLGAAGLDFQVIYVTVDPERDTAERLREYLSFFDASFVGATGTAGELERVRKAYGIQVSKKTPAGTKATYLVHHSSSVYLIDRDGRLRAMVPFGVSAGDVLHDAKSLLGR